MRLYRAVFPECAEQNHDLYFRAIGPATVCDDSLAMQTGTTVRFDTYFNGFFYTKYLKYTQAKTLTVKIRCSGKLEAKLACITPDLIETVIETIQLSGREVIEEFGPVMLQDLPSDGMLFCAFAAREASIISEISYETEISRPNQVYIAGVICTYRREAYVKRNLRRIDAQIWQNIDSPAAQSLDVLVVDNGRTLPPGDRGHVAILPNKNCGGSGGFARGMLEALHSEKRYTHVLLMDDDISFEPSVLERTVQLLKAAKPMKNPLCIGGQMLVESDPTSQYESGSRYAGGRLYPVNRGLDLSGLESLLQNGRESPVDYNAWWYCCIPLELVREKGLPLPLFIKTDDVEYGLRSGAEFLLMNGIGVWHKAFAEKQAAHLEYYIKRNELVVSALRQRGDGVLCSIHKLFCSLGGSILRGQTDQIGYIEWGYRDFLKGPGFLLEADAEKLNRSLIDKKAEKPPATITAFLGSAAIVLVMFFQFLVRYRAVQKDLMNSQDELTSERFWRKQLELEGGKGLYLR